MDAILSSVRDAMNTTFPLKKVSRKEAKKLQNPWMTKEILKKHSNRDKLKKYGSLLAIFQIHLSIMCTKVPEIKLLK